MDESENITQDNSQKTKDENGKKHNGTYMNEGIAFGASFGVIAGIVIGSISGNMGLAIGIALPLGVGFGLCIGMNMKKKQHEE
jgi:F0F1-type ATP synthase assembly protein I